MAIFRRSNNSRTRSPTPRATSSDEPSYFPTNLKAILNEPALAIERRLEMSVFMGVEKNRTFRIFRPDGGVVGYIEEMYDGIRSSIKRYVTSLPSTMVLYDSLGNHLLTIRRPYSTINSRIKCYTPDNVRIGESQQEWHLWRRQYKLYLASSENNAERIQFGRINGSTMCYEFPIENEQHQVVGSIDKTWTGFARELFTNTSVYFIRFCPDKAPERFPDQELPVNPRPLSLAEKAVMLATAISVDMDYFSPNTSTHRRHRGFSGNSATGMYGNVNGMFGTGTCNGMGGI